MLGEQLGRLPTLEEGAKLREKQKDRPTPLSAERRRALAKALLEQGSQIKHVDSPLEAIGSVLQSAAGAWNARKADQEEKDIQGRRSSALSQMAQAAFGGAGFGSLGAIDAGGETPQGTMAASIPASERASYIRSGLISRGLPEHVADGFLVNFQDESGLDPGINERNPTVPGSRGGFGLYQLTGPRRNAYENFAAGRGVDPSDIDTQLDFMVGELGVGDPGPLNAPWWGSESRAAQSIMSASDTSGAAQAIVNDFLRPAPEHRASRTRRYAGLSNSAAPVQVASLDPSAGVAEATGAPRSIRQIVEAAAAKQGVDPASLAEFGSEDIQEIQSRPRDPQAVPYSGPGATIDPRDVRGLVPYTGPPLRDPNGMSGVAPVGMPGASPEADARIQRFHTENGTTPMQYRGPGQSGVSGAPGARIDDPAGMQAGNQVAALDPAAGQPRTVRQIAEAAVEQQERANAPIPTPRPEVMAAGPTPQARPSPLNAQGYATELPTVPPRPAGDVRQMGQLLLADRSQGFGTSQSFGQPPYNPEMIAQLLGDPATEDIGQQMLSDVLRWRQQNEQFARQQYIAAETRRYEAEKAARDRAAGNEDYRLRKGIDQEFQKPEGAQWQELPNGDYGYFDPTTRTFEKLGSAPKPASGGGGVTISPDGTIQVGGSGGSPTNIPSGFMVDPNDPRRLAPIPGGPGEQIGGENAGRIGIAKSFLQDLPDIRKQVAEGGVTGLWDAMTGRAGLGQQGRLYARIESGADALQRMLSGAGMPDAEAAAYARRYMPTATDTTDLVAQKLGQLERELSNQMDIVTRGRGDVMGDGGQGRPAQPAADYKTRYGLE